MEQVQAISGVCLFARDPRSLADWYNLHLGLNSHYSEELDAYCHEFIFVDPRHPERTLRFCWAVREATRTEHRSRAMLCFRVQDLDGVMATLRASGITVEDAGEGKHGRRARLTDPEGNTVELLEEHHALPRHNVVML